MTMPMSPSLAISVIVPCRKAPAGWNAPLVGAGTWGASRTLLIEHGAVGRARSAGLVPTGRIPPQTNLDVKLSALF
jgi:hypothetical protein